jgi:hypothetical protein
MGILVDPKVSIPAYTSLKVVLLFLYQLVFLFYFFRVAFVLTNCYYYFIILIFNFLIFFFRFGPMKRVMNVALFKGYLV